MRINTRGDTLAAEQLLHTVENDPGFRIFCERLELTAKRAARDLVTASMEDVPRLQERVQTIEMVLALPRQIITELRSKR